MTRGVSRTSSSNGAGNATSQRATDACGVNVDLFAGVLGAEQTLTLTTDQDAYLVGVVTVTAPTRS